jgi:hypothetical protein
MHPQSTGPKEVVVEGESGPVKVAKKPQKARQRCWSRAAAHTWRRVRLASRGISLTLPFACAGEGGGWAIPRRAQRHGCP